MTQQIEHHGYEIVAIKNKKIHATIKNNMHTSKNENDGTQKFLKYVPPITFVFQNYNSMISFIDENPRG